ncbi:MAG TPA: hypothetical protein VII47_02250 [Actinomycetota bacterium]|jgi:hypothetical protein
MRVITDDRPVGGAGDLDVVLAHLAAASVEEGDQGLGGLRDLLVPAGTGSCELVFQW